MTGTMVVPLPGNETIAASVASRLHADISVPDVRTFPDGETYFRLVADVRNRAVALISTLDRPDPKIMALILAAGELRSLGAARVGLVAPYLAYMRQDRSFHTGEAVAARAFGALLSRYFDWVVTVDPHLHRIQTLSEIFSIPSRVVHAAPLISDWIVSHVPNPVLLGPDIESSQWVSRVATNAKAGFVVLQKTRLNAREVKVSIPDMARWHHHTPVLIDDIISTGATMRETLSHLAALGMKPAVCVGVHAIFAQGAYDKLLHCRPAQVVTTNTVAHATNAIDVSQIVADAVRELLT